MKAAEERNRLRNVRVNGGLDARRKYRGAAN
jgi:hypothetical protein